MKECPKCGNKDTKIWGFYYKKGNIKVLRYTCVKCDISFSENFKNFGNLWIDKHKRNPLRNKKEDRKKYHEELKRIAFNHYTKGTFQCANPYNIDHKSFEQDKDYIKSLQIDHINGGGRKQGLGGYMLCVWLIKNGYPENYQILCPTCNILKRIKNMEIPYRNKTL